MSNEFGPSIGTYKKRDVPEWISDTESGIRRYYVRNIGKADSVDLRELRNDEIVIAPGLIYGRTEKAAPLC